MARSRWMALWMALAALTIAALAGCAVPPPPAAPAPPPAPPAPETPPPAAPAPQLGVSSDQDFINRAAGMNAREIGMGRLAHGKGAAKPLRLFAQRMAFEHIELQKRLAALAKHLKLDVAAADRPPAELLTTIGPDFDRHYMALVVKGQEDLITLYEGEAAGGQDPRARRFAREVLPMLRLHLKEAETLGHKLGV